MRGNLAIAATFVGALAPLVGCTRDEPSKTTEPAPTVLAAPPSASGATAASSAPSASAAPPASTGVSALPLASASVAQAVNPKGYPVYSGPTGSIEGTVWIEGPPSPDVTGKDFKRCPDAAKVYGKLFREGAPGPNGARALADAIVGVTDYAPGYFVPERVEAVKVTIDGCAFSPRTIAMTYGQRIDITNNTKFIIAPALDRARTPALMIAPPEAKGDPVRIYPPHPGFYTLEDQMDLAYLNADVYVLAFPFHAATGTDGHFRIDGIPVGKAKIFTRLRAIGRETGKDVEILANVVQKVDLTLRYEPKDAGAPAPASSDRPRTIP